jgi:hypothetical protein
VVVSTSRIIKEKAVKMWGIDNISLQIRTIFVFLRLYRPTQTHTKNGKQRSLGWTLQPRILARRI